MARKQALSVISLQSAADFSTNGLYRFGTVNSSGAIGLTGAAARADGVIQGNPAAADRAVGVAINGVTLLELGGTVAAGGTIQSGASGVGVSGSTNSRAIAITGGVSGDIIEALLN